MTAVIEAEQLKRNFGQVKAVDGLTFRVEEGQVFGLLDPNGAGKTTTVRLLNGVLMPSGGRTSLKSTWLSYPKGKSRTEAGALKKVRPLRWGHH